MSLVPADREANLRRAGLLNAAPHRVTDPLFRQQPEFFDPRDRLQVQYEMLRAHMVDGDSVVNVCGRFGASRQTFYNLRQKLTTHGTAGLLHERPGPRGPSKVKPAILELADEMLATDPHMSTTALREAISRAFDVKLHRRTVERLANGLRSKKNSIRSQTSAPGSNSD